MAKLELSAPKNECFTALFGQKEIERKKYSSKLKFSSSVMPTMFPRLVQHQLNPSTQQHLGNVSCISPKWLKSWSLIIDSQFWPVIGTSSWTIGNLGYPQCSPGWCSISATKAPNCSWAMSAVSAVSLWEIKISAILGWYSWNCPSAVGCFGWADAAPAWGTLWACKILD